MGAAECQESHFELGKAKTEKTSADGSSLGLGPGDAHTRCPVPERTVRSIFASKWFGGSDAPVAPASVLGNMFCARAAFSSRFMTDFTASFFDLTTGEEARPHCAVQLVHSCRFGPSEVSTTYAAPTCVTICASRNWLC